MKEFTTAVKSPRETGEDEVTAPVTIKVDGREITFRGATSTEMFTLMAAVSDVSSLEESISTSVNLLYALMEDADRRWYRRRLFDKEDSFDYENVSEHILYLIEEWSANPIESPSDSDSSSHRSGPPSTARQRSGAKTR